MIHQLHLSNHFGLFPLSLCVEAGRGVWKWLVTLAHFQGLFRRLNWAREMGFVLLGADITEADGTEWTEK